MATEYLVSEIEMNRRKKALFTLSISLIVGFSLALRFLNVHIAPAVYILFVAALLLLNIYFFGFFHRLLRIRIYLSDAELERINREKSEHYPLADVSGVRVKRTINGPIREMTIIFRNGMSVMINGMDHFENFFNELVKKLSKDVQITQFRELVDFDHPIFYSLLGLPISFFGVYLVRLLAELDAVKTKILFSGFAIYTLSIGAFFIYTKPLAKRYGLKMKLADYIYGTVIICIGFILFIVSEWY
jgi:hypothetical protein